MLEKGIVIFALGHPMYGCMAFNLAVTIKAVDFIPVCVVYDDTAISHLSSQQTIVFDEMVHAPHLKPGCGVKLSAYNLSPYEETIVLDADMIWLPRKTPAELFSEIGDRDFLAISEGDTDNPSGEYFFWANVDEVREKYGVDKIHQWRTEVMYFKKGDVAEKIFTDAIAINEKPGLSYVKEFAGGIPDELGINIGCAISEIESLSGFKPSYWPSMHQHRIPEFDTLYRNYYLLSVGGNHATENVKKFYNQIVKAQAPKIGLQHCFPLQSKHTYLVERRKS